jgi:hypothetical protein
MNANFGGDEVVLRQLHSELTETALRVASRYGMPGPQAEQRLDLWEALSRVVRERGQATGVRTWRETLVAEAASAAYQVVLDRGFRGSFLDLELDLWKSLCSAIRQSRLVPELFHPT